jgi:hypothetical protein
MPYKFDKLNKAMLSDLLHTAWNNHARLLTDNRTPAQLLSHEK